jgi:hypothetical protein
VIQSPVELLVELAKGDASIRWGEEDGLIHVAMDDGVPHELRRACLRWKWVLRWGLHGADRGYRWCACGTCGSLTPLAKKAGGACTMTFGCTGRSQDIPLPRFSLGGVRPMTASAAEG